jgi:predicted dehydrogenase
MHVPVRLAVVGAGWWSSKVHAPQIVASPVADLVAVADPAADRRAAFADAFGIRHTFADHRAMLEAVRPDGVVVATPHTTHARIAADSLAAGAGVLVEKPFTIRPSDAWDLVALAERERLPLVVGLPYPFHPHAATVRRLLADGVVGRLVSVTGSFHSYVQQFYRGRPEEYHAVHRYPLLAPEPGTYADPARSGGGQGQTQLSHLVGLLLAELPEPPVLVSAQMSWLAPGIDLAVSTTLSTPAGSVISLSSAGTATGPDSCTGILRYDGTDGWIEHDALQGTLTASGPLPSLRESEFGVYPAAAPVHTLIRLLMEPAYSNPADGRLGARTVDVVSACYASAATGGRPITLPGR